MVKQLKKQITKKACVDLLSELIHSVYGYQIKYPHDDHETIYNETCNDIIELLKNRRGWEETR